MKIIAKSEERGGKEAWGRGSCIRQKFQIPSTKFQTNNKYKI
jgi:hypothetical protein